MAFSHYVIATVTGSSGSAVHALDPRPPLPLAVEINNLFKCKHTSVIAIDETQQLRCVFFLYKLSVYVQRGNTITADIIVCLTQVIDFFLYIFFVIR